MLLEVDELRKEFTASSRGRVRAVDGVSFDVAPGEIVGIVGESGSGKSTLGRLILRLLEPTSGSVRLRETDVTGLGRRELRRLRTQMSMVFQDPSGSLNPRMTVAANVGFPLKASGAARGVALRRKVIELLEHVGLGAAHAERLPHQLSGGQRQRVALARAIALDPVLIIADEAVSALDLSTQAQVLNLIRDLQQEHGMSWLFITHDLGVAEYLCDRILVMYAGRIVESGTREDLFRTPAHPYTRALMAAASLADIREPTPVFDLKAEAVDPRNLPTGCKFHPRCPHAMPVCGEREPGFREARPGHAAACFLVEPS